MADSYLAFLRDRRVDAIDLRPVFARAGAGNFWLQDEHMNLRAQELIAAELHPLVVAARPPGATRARRAPVSAGANPGDLLSPGSASTPVAEAATAESTQAMLELVSFEEPDAARLFVERPHTVFDPLAGYRYASDLELPSQELGLGERFSFVTNSQGLRNDEELAAADLRIVITGDEQVAGACPNPTTFAGLLEAALRRQRPGERIEALNAGVVGYSFFNYLGVLARSLELDPDVFVLTVSSGSDFLEGLRINCLLAGRKFWRSADGAREAFQAARQVSRPALEQGFESLHYFREHRPQGQRAYKVALDATLAVRDLCAEHGIELVVLHLPSAIDVEWKRHAAVFEQLGETLGIEQRYMNTNLRLVAPYLQELQRIGVAVIDLEETLAGSEQPLYGADDFLITPAAHALIAERLLERLDELGLAGR